MQVRPVGGEIGDAAPITAPTADTGAASAGAPKHASSRCPAGSCVPGSGGSRLQPSGGANRQLSAPTRSISSYSSRLVVIVRDLA